jgi:hypothetical protein
MSCCMLLCFGIYICMTGSSPRLLLLSLHLSEPDSEDKDASQSIAQLLNQLQESVVCGPRAARLESSDSLESTLEDHQEGAGSRPHGVFSPVALYNLSLLLRVSVSCSTRPINAPHCVSHSLPLTVSVTRCLSRYLSLSAFHCVSATLLLTVSLIRCLSLCVSVTAFHCVSHQCLSVSLTRCLSLCFSLTASHCVSHSLTLTVFLSHCLSLCLSDSLPLTVSRTYCVPLCFSLVASHCVSLAHCLSLCLSHSLPLTVSRTNCLSLRL